MLSAENIVYTARATAQGGRKGHVRSEDGIVDLDLAAPPETGGPGGASNPEQLFAAGYAACYQNAFERLAKRDGVDAAHSRVTAEVGFGRDADASGFALSVTLRASVAGVDLEVVRRLMAAAHEVCPYSKATRGNIPVELVAEPG
jgi:osmotically inducible protein OsmC